MNFDDAMRLAAEAFKPLDGPIRIISHLDCDGMASAAILIEAIKPRRYTLTIIQQLSSSFVESLSDIPEETILFSDLGSGQLKAINRLTKRVFIFDHHEPDKTPSASHVTHLNAHLYGVDGSGGISGAGVCYYFAKALDVKNTRLAHLAIIGAIGDVQENDGFKGVNEAILQEAIAAGTLEVHRGLRFFGQQTKPLHKLLEYATDPYIPGVSGSESGAIELLEGASIEPKQGDKWRRIIDLTEDELKRLVGAIVARRAGIEKPQDVLGNVYILSHEEPGSQFRDAKEFSTLLNACGRLNKAQTGIAACLGDPQAKRRALEIVDDYRKAMVGAMHWFADHRGTGEVIEAQGYLIIDARNHIKPSIIGTMASIIASSGEFPEGTLIISLASQDDGSVKISVREAGRTGRDLRKIIGKIASAVGGESGGHMNAAGAVIPKDKVDDFIQKAKEIIGQERP